MAHHGFLVSGEKSIRLTCIKQGRGWWQTLLLYLQVHPSVSMPTEGIWGPRRHRYNARPTRKGGGKRGLRDFRRRVHLLKGKIKYNKLWGLKKLRIIAKQLEGIAYVTPFKVYDSPSQVRKSHYGNAERVLIRTDERGKRYQHLDWGVMPRESLLGNPSYPFPVERVKGKMEELHTRLNEILWNGGRKARFIVHPTRKFDRVTDASHTEGRIEIRGNMIGIQYGGIWYEYHSREKTFSFYNGRRVERKKSMKRQVLKNIQRLIDVALESKQLSARKDREYVLRFLTWNDNPSLLELYDLQEFRTLPYPKKKGN